MTPNSVSTISTPSVSSETAVETPPVMATTETQTPLTLCNEKFDTIGEILSSNDFVTFGEDLVTLVQSRTSLNIKEKVKQLIGKLKNRTSLNIKGKAKQLIGKLKNKAVKPNDMIDTTNTRLGLVIQVPSDKNATNTSLVKQVPPDKK